MDTKIEEIANTVFRSAVRLDRRPQIVVSGLSGALCWIAKRYGITLETCIEGLRQTWQMVPDREPFVPFRQVSQEELDQVLRDNGFPPMGPIKS